MQVKLIFGLVGILSLFSGLATATNFDSTGKIAAGEAETGVVEDAAGHADAADAHYRRALSIWNQLAPDRATYSSANDSIDHDQLRAVVTSRLGSFYSESAAPQRGRPLLKEAVAMLRAPTLSNPAELAFALNSLGMLELRAGDYKAGDSNLREAVSVATDALGESHPDTAVYESNLALALSLEGQYGRAEVLLNRARFIVETRLPDDSPRFASLLGTVLAELAAVETSQGQFARAEADGQQSLAILSRGREPESQEVAVDKVMLAALYLRERKVAEAEKILPEAVAVERRVADRRILADGIRRLGELRALQHNWREAQTLYSEAIAICESTLGPAHPVMAPMLREYADVLKHSGAPRAEVKNIEARAKAIKT